MPLSIQSAIPLRRSVIPAEPTDAALADAIAGVRVGAPAAIAVVYGWYAADLVRLLTRLMGARADAEDAVHDLFVGLPEHLGRYDERGRFRPWLRATAIGIARMHVRRTNRRAAVLARETQESLRTATPGDLSLTMDVERAVAGLSDPLRAVFVLRHWEGFSHDEIAALLDITPGASRVRHARALEILRSQLDR